GRSRAVTRAFLAALALAFAVQSALTFSRGGLYVATAGALGLAAPLVGDARSRRPTLAVAAVVLLAGAAAAFLPNGYTGGTLATRYSDTEPTQRGRAVVSDLQL